MRNIIAVFGNRNHTMQFASYLKRLGIRCKTINTPRELTVSCGISIVFLERDLQRVRGLIYQLKLSSYVGMYLILSDNVFTKYKKI